MSTRFACFASLVLLTVSAPQQQTPDPPLPPEPQFGVIEAHDAHANADALSATWSRARFHWAYIQPDSAEQWIEAEITGEEIEREAQAGREVIGLLIGIPEWAQAADGLPRGLYLPHTDPGNLWAAFVRQAVNTYAQHIDHWIMWNEPDIWDSTHPAYAWPGDEADYLQLMRTAYLTAKDANPDAVVHLGGISHWWDVNNNRTLFLERYFQLLVDDPMARENGYFYDVLTLHLYFTPASVYEVTRLYDDLQAGYGLDKPIWLIETNAAPSLDPAWPVEDITFRVSLTEQAAYMPQAMAMALAAGVERIGIYKLIDTPGDLTANPEPFGLVRADGSPRPAFITSQTAIEQLRRAEFQALQQGAGFTSVVFENESRQIRVLWATRLEAVRVSVPAAGDEAVLIDMWGSQTIISPRDGAYEITLYSGECRETTGSDCMIGGPPVYLTEPHSDQSAAPVSLLASGESALSFAPAQADRRPRWWFAAAGLCALLLTGAIWLRQAM